VFVIKGPEGAGKTEGDAKVEAKAEEPKQKKPHVFIRDFNIWVSTEDEDEDQADQVSFGGTVSNPFDVDDIYLSPDGQFFVAWQFFPKVERSLQLIESSPNDQLQPKLHTYQYFRPGDRLRLERPRMFDLERRCEVPTSDALFRVPFELENWGWSKNGSEYRFQFNERGHQHLRVIGMRRDGTVRALVEESSDTFIDYTDKYYKFVIERSNSSESELLWASERDGWNHLYLFDLESGLLRNQVTSGAWNVHSVEEVDEVSRTILFRGYGMVPGQDP